MKTTVNTMVGTSSHAYEPGNLVIREGEDELTKDHPEDLEVFAVQKIRDDGFLDCMRITKPSHISRHSLRASEVVPFYGQVVLEGSP